MPLQCLSGSQDHTDVPDCKELLEFIDLRAQAAEASNVDRKLKSTLLKMMCSGTHFWHVGMTL